MSKIQGSIVSIQIDQHHQFFHLHAVTPKWIHMFSYWYLSTVQVPELLGSRHEQSFSLPVPEMNLQSDSTRCSHFNTITQKMIHNQINERQAATSSLSSLALWFFGSLLNSSVNRRHSCKFSGETKSAATFVQDWKCQRKVLSWMNASKEWARGEDILPSDSEPDVGNLLE